MRLGNPFVVIPLFLSLGFDTFAVAIGMGIAGSGGRRLRFALAFATVEAIMPLVGLALGQVVTAAIGTAANYVAIAVLIATGAYLVWESFQEEGGQERVHGSTGLVLLLTALSVSMDELAVGFGLGLLRVSIVLSIVYIGVQAFGVTFFGISMGRHVGENWAERAETAGGLILITLGLLLLALKIAGIRL